MATLIELMSQVRERALQEPDGEHLARLLGDAIGRVNQWGHFSLPFRGGWVRETYAPARAWPGAWDAEDGGPWGALATALLSPGGIRPRGWYERVRQCAGPSRGGVAGGGEAPGFHQRDPLLTAPLRLSSPDDRAGAFGA
jgi:hypothetical protein